MRKIFAHVWFWLFPPPVPKKPVKAAIHYYRSETDPEDADPRSTARGDNW